MIGSIKFCFSRLETRTMTKLPHTSARCLQLFCYSHFVSELLKKALFPYLLFLTATGFCKSRGACVPNGALSSCETGEGGIKG